MMDPIDNIVGPAVTKRMKSWGCGAADGNCGPYSPLTISPHGSCTYPAENALAGGEGATSQRTLTISVRWMV
ncbi:MAG: hypothetical protein CM1200mP14_25900 [Gammaproteobacteria bacterium]|nr:MAG: hypothetical protein CM1200mP14_25900 [Gammaproteobacteria bacterium]